MKQLVLLDSAKEDLVAIFRFITNTSHNIVVARSFVDKLYKKCEDLAQLPAVLGVARPELHKDIRSYAYKNYVIFFRYRENIFEVVAILEGHRDVVGFFKRNQPLRSDLI